MTLRQAAEDARLRPAPARRWRTLILGEGTRSSTLNRKVLYAVVLIATLTSLAKLASMGRDLLISGTFGTSDLVDAFFLAFVLPSFVVSAVAGTLPPALIPALSREQARAGADGARVLVPPMMGYSLVGLMALTGMLAMAIPFIMPALASGFSAEKLGLTISLSYALLPVVLLSGLATTVTAALHAEERFFAASLAPLATPLLTIGFILALGGKLGAHAIAWGIICGLVLEGLVLAAVAVRRGYSIRPSFLGQATRWRGFARDHMPLVGGSVLMGSTVLVDSAMASTLAPGSVATLTYGGKLVALVLGIASLAVTTAIFPSLSRLAAEREWTTLRSMLRTWIGVVLVAASGLALVLIVWSQEIISLLFLRGAFGPSDAASAGVVHAFLAIQIPFYMGGMIGVRMLSALGQGRLILLISAWNLIANATGNYLLMGPLGVAGIALSTSMVYLISFCLVGLAVRHALKGRQGVSPA